MSRKNLAPTNDLVHTEMHPSQIASQGERDANHGFYEPRLRDMPLKVVFIPRLIALSFIRLYQMTVSQLLPADTCRFYPSCSHYGYQAIYKYGLIKGGALAVWRVLRCNPFNRGGFDPVP